MIDMMLIVMMKESMMTLTVEPVVCRPVMRLSFWKELSMVMLTANKSMMLTPKKLVMLTAKKLVMLTPVIKLAV